MYLISKILVCLTIAFAIGLALGWLLRRSIAIGNARSSDKHWSQRLRSAEQDREIAVAKLKSDVEEYRAQIPTLEQSLADRSDLIARLETENSELRDGAGPLRERLGAIEADAAKEAAAHEETRAAKAAVEAALEDSARRIEALEEEVAAAQDAQQRAVSLEALVARRDSERQQLSVENEKLVKRYAEAVEVSQEQVSRNHALQSASDALEARLAEQAEAIAQLEQQGARASVTADGLRAELDEAQTHDDLWNAAQRQLKHDGRIENYLRMLWGKKVLHWSRTPEEAYATLVELNNRYAVDGRDPNSYTGIRWTFGAFDRPWGPERDVFGTVRYMTSDSTRRKLKLDAYLERWGEQTLFS